MLLLVGRQCASSTESFIAAMRELRHVTLAGDRTAGSTANPQTFMLGGGWSYSVSRWIEYTANMQVIEDQGIAPSLVVPASPARLSEWTRPGARLGDRPVRSGARIEADGPVGWAAYRAARA